MKDAPTPFSKIKNLVRTKLSCFLPLCTPKKGNFWLHFNVQNILIFRDIAVSCTVHAAKRLAVSPRRENAGTHLPQQTKTSIKMKRLEKRFSFFVFQHERRSVQQRLFCFCLIYRRTPTHEKTHRKYDTPPELVELMYGTKIKRKTRPHHIACE